ncbi:hypothetical protein [Pelagicoccus sp. SDUM812003]|uniref:WD40/YVTN/BNR-like repeat-containing protein n=1 Tax=Pelagicoccus sp. SDUM812003 TaxID=3041267 RepID=UPI00280C8594|nr:hypothetical protein [Pelagicoccus sp. SDUM812003]MDQ8201510.1 hypothetical protein [Pelagicoccus sp. SDUM812003]
MQRPQHDMLRLFFRLLAILALSAPSFASEANHTQWASVRIGGGGFVSAIIANPSEPGLIYARTDVGGAYRWDDSSATWIALNDWTSREDVGYLGVESLATDPNFPNRLYLFVGTSYFSDGRSAILRSDDYGETFEIIEVTDQFKAHGNGIGRQNGEKLQVDPFNSDILYCGTRYDGLFKSLDRGSSWSRLETLPVTATEGRNGVAFVIIDPSSEHAGAAQTLYAGISRTSENLYRSTDAGQTWSLAPGAPAQMPQRGALASDGSLYLTFGNGAGPHGDWVNSAFTFDTGGVWKLDTRDDSWTNITPSGFTRAFGGVSVDPADPQRLIVSTINTWMEQDTSAQPASHGDRFLLSTDGGSSWTDLVARGFELDPNGVTWIPGQSIHWAGSIEFDPFDTDTVWVTSGNGVYRCADIDATPTVWQFTVRGLEETVPENLVSIPDGPTISVIKDYDGFLHSDPHVYAPVHKPGIGSTTGLTFASQNSALVYRVGSSLYRSEDQGKTWTKAPQIEGPNGHIALNADGSVLLHAPEGSSVTYRSEDQGATWAPVSGLSVSDARPIADPENSDIFYVLSDTTLFRSDDAGKTFAAAANDLPSGAFDRLATVFDHLGHLWLAHPTRGLYRSTDAGATFSQLDSVDAARAVGTGKAAPEASYPTLFVWGSIDGVEGVFRSTDQGASWLRINDDQHQFGGPGNAHFVIGDQNRFGRVYMSTAGRGIAFGEPAGDSISYQTWSQSVFSASQQTKASISGEQADPDRDGLSNLVEWILQTDPLTATDLAGRTFVLDMAPPQIAIQQLAELSSATLTLRVSHDLVLWSPITDLFQEETIARQADSLTRHRRFVPTSDTFPSPLFLKASATR